MIVLGIETSTPHSSVALGTEREVLGATEIAGKARQEVVVPALEHLLRLTGVDLDHVGGIAVGLGPGLFTGLRVGVETGKALAQVLRIPIVGIHSLDTLAFGARTSPRLIAAVIDARRGEVFSAFYRSVPGGVLRETDFQVGSPDHLVAELVARREEVLMVGDGATLYRRTFEEVGGKVEFAGPARAYPQASALVELAVPRFIREEFDRLFEIRPLYLRKSDAEIAWDKRAGSASA